MNVSVNMKENGYVNVSEIVNKCECECECEQEWKCDGTGHVNGKLNII